MNVEQELERALACTPGKGKVLAMLPRAEEIYRRLVDDLGAALQKDVVKARGQIKALLGDEVKLVPEDGNLVAEIRGDYAGLLSTIAPKISLVAGTPFWVILASL